MRTAAEGRIHFHYDVVADTLLPFECALPIHYPRRAAEQEIKGEVELQLLKDTTCLLTNTRVIRNPHPLLSEAAQEGAKELIRWSRIYELTEFCEEDRLLITFTF